MKYHITIQSKVFMLEISIFLNCVAVTLQRQLIRAELLTECIGR